MKRVAEEGEMNAWIQPGKYHSIFDPGRWREPVRYLRNKKIVLVDRDGVINKKAAKGEYVACWKELSWIDETYEAMSRLAGKGIIYCHN